MPGVATQQFASQAGPSSEERHSQIDSPVDTIGPLAPATLQSTGQEKKDVTTSSNKPEQGHREDMSDFVTGKPSATNGSAPLATNGSTNSKLVNILDRVTLMFYKSDAELEKKKGKFNELKGRKEEVESYLSEKEKEIERLESETHDASIKLTKEKRRREMAQEVVAEQQQKIEQFQQYVYQKNRELQEEKDDKQEKCERLKQAEADLQKQTAAKERAENKLSKANERLKKLEDEAEKATCEVDTTYEEREKIKHVLQWTTRDLEEEKEEIDEVMEWIRTRNVAFRYSTILGFLAVIVVLVSYAVQTYVKTVRNGCED